MNHPCRLCVPAEIGWPCPEPPENVPAVSRRPDETSASGTRTRGFGRRPPELGPWPRLGRRPTSAGRRTGCRCGGLKRLQPGGPPLGRVPVQPRFERHGCSLEGSSGRRFRQRVKQGTWEIAPRPRRQTTSRTQHRAAACAQPPAGADSPLRPRRRDILLPRLPGRFPLRVAPAARNACGLD